MSAATCPVLVAPPAQPEHGAADLIRDARAQERAGRLMEAIETYMDAAALAERRDQPATLAEALRRLAVLRFRDDSEQARELCRRSLNVAQGVHNEVLAAEALNTLGGIEMMTGSLKEARAHLIHALTLGDRGREVCARVEQNLGILANIQGDLDEALARYSASLEAYQACGDEHGCALAYHNLGMVSADLELYDEADRYFAQSRAIAERAGDVYLQALCLANHAEVHVARQRYEDARDSAECALAIFTRLGAWAEQAGACRVLGMVYRETGRHEVAETQLRQALDLAAGARSVLNEAEASRELALLYQAMGRNLEALRLLNAAHRLFGQLDARRDLVNVDGKVAALEGAYLAVVREWGESIESKDTYTFGHCERVAQNAVAVARALGLGPEEQTAIRLGAYLHDVGKVKVPSEILNKPGPLSEAECELVKSHPAWAIELLAGIEFPWDIKPIIRAHHERFDGTGYPDGLRAGAIPLGAQIVGIADVYDALTTDRPYRRGMALAECCAEMTRMRSAWSAPVFEAFLRALPELRAGQGNGEGGRASAAAWPA